MKNKGFTLIEMMVTVLIFSIIIGVTIGVFISAIRMQRYSLTYQQLLGQTSYAIEYMSRMIRMARKNTAGICPGMDANMNYQVTDGETHIKFVNYEEDDCLEFFWDATQKQLKVDRIGYTEPLLLISEDLEVSSLNFYLSGESDADLLQPRVTIFMKVQGRGSGPQPKIEIQTTVSQRNLDK